MTFLSAALLTTLLALPGSVRAQDSSKVVPANAQAKQYGSGWECKPGFRRDGAGCATIKLPANAYLSDDTYGPGWACKREYKAEGNSCVAVKLLRTPISSAPPIQMIGNASAAFERPEPPVSP
jgi:hypothetical protein